MNDRHTELERLATFAAIKVGPDGDWYCRDVIESDRDISAPHWAREFTAAASPAVVLRLVAIARAAEKALDFFTTYSSLNEGAQDDMAEEKESTLAALREALEAGRASIEGVDRGG